jgi:hypothetical protein
VVSPDDVFVVDFVSSDLALSDLEDFDLVGRVVSELPLSRGAVVGSVGSLFAAVSDTVLVSRDRVSEDEGDKSSVRRGGADSVGGVSWMVLLATVLLSTSAAKLSFPEDELGSGRADRCAAP